MNTDLQSRMDEIIAETGDKPFDVRERKIDSERLVHRMGIHGLENEVDEVILKGLLLRMPQQKIILRQFASHYEVVRGQRLLNTLYAILQNANTFTPRNLERRIQELEHEVVVLHASMTDEQCEYAINLITHQ